MGQIKAIGFDYGGVIGGGSKVGRAFTAEVCQVLNIEQEIYRQTYFSMNYLINTGEVATWREFWQLLLKRLGIDPVLLDPLMLISLKYSRIYIEMDKQIIDLIDLLRSRGYKTGLLSNATMENGRQMRGASLDQHFDAFLISSEIKVQKPDPQAFKQLAQDLGVDLEELVFVDDTERSLATAAELGFTPILYKSYDQLVTELANLKLL